MDDRYAVGNHPRAYPAFPVGPDDGPPVRRADPAGIVFHTTESAQAAFSAEENGTLRRIGESLLDYVRRKRAYHFVIDRFGRVYRVVSETDAANHAGYLGLGDERWIYVNLNESFLGVSFETKTAPDRKRRGHHPRRRSGRRRCWWKCCAAATAFRRAIASRTRRCRSTRPTCRPGITRTGLLASLSSRWACRTITRGIFPPYGPLDFSMHPARRTRRNRGCTPAPRGPKGASGSAHRPRESG